MRAWHLEVNAKAMLLICEQAAAEETLRAERAERNLGEMRALQAKWEQELAQKDRTNAEQVHRRSHPSTTRMAHTQPTSQLAFKHVSRAACVPLFWIQHHNPDDDFEVRALHVNMPRPL